MKYLSVCLLFLLFPTLCFANGKKAPKIVVTFHLESPPDPGKKMTFEWQTSIGKKNFRVTSEFKTHEIVGQRPFPSPHSETEYGMIFQFDRDAKRRLAQLTTANKGKYLICFINGKPIDMLKIDQTVNDGIICVWRGLMPSDVHKADELVPRIGEDKATWKKRMETSVKRSSP